MHVAKARVRMYGLSQAMATDGSGGGDAGGGGGMLHQGDGARKLSTAEAKKRSECTDLARKGGGHGEPAKAAVEPKKCVVEVDAPEDRHVDAAITAVDFASVEFAHGARAECMQSDLKTRRHDDCLEFPGFNLPDGFDDNSNMVSLTSTEMLGPAERHACG